MAETDGRAILITGAGKRVGALLARHLAATGTTLVLHYNRSQADASVLAETLRKTGATVHTIGAALDDQEAAATLLPRAAELAGKPLNVLINNASVLDYDAPLSVNDEVASEAWQVNAHAPVRLAASFMAQADPLADNVIINFLDQKLRNLNPDFYTYTLSKAALAAATEMMDMAYRERGGRACGIAPGPILKSFDQSQEEFSTAASVNPLGRPIDPEDIGTAVRYVLAAPGLRNQVIHVDNGQRLWPAARDILFTTREGAPA